MINVTAKSFILNFTSTALAWAAFGIGISLLSNKTWQIFRIEISGVTNVSYIGLYSTCYPSSDSCIPLPKYPWLVSVRALLITMLTTASVGANIDMISNLFNRHWLLLKKLSVATYILSGACGVSALSVYTGNTFTSSTTSYDSGFILGWCAAWCPVISAITAGWNLNEIKKLLFEKNDVILNISEVH